MESKKKRILVLGSDNSSVALSIIRSLGRVGYVVNLATDSRQHLGLYSRYCSDHILLPPIAEDVARFYEKFDQILKTRSYDLVIPVTDTTIIPLYSAGYRSRHSTKVVLPEADTFELVYNKSKTLEIAERIGIRTPLNIEVKNVETLNFAIEALRYPIVVKPVYSKTLTDNRIENHRVIVAYNKEELFRATEEILQKVVISVQEYVWGVGVAQTFVAKNGHASYPFEYERVHQPSDGGGSSYRRSVKLVEQSQKKSCKLLQAIGWTGVAMVEYIKSADGYYFLMEINPRFWGSLPLAEHSGMNYPQSLVRLFLDGEAPQSKMPYQVNIYARNLAKEAVFWRTPLSDSGTGGQYSRSFTRAAVIKHLGLLFQSNQYLDEFSTDDARPLLTAIWLLLKTLLWNIFTMARQWNPLRSLYFLCLKKTMSLNFMRQRDSRRLKAQVITGQKSLCFVCKGNICRSIFAEERLRILLRENALRPKISSAGLRVKASANPDHQSVQSASRFGLILGRNTPRKFDHKLVLSTDIIVAFEIWQYVEIRRKLAKRKNEVFLLGMIDMVRDIEIADPFNAGAGSGLIFERINQCLKLLVGSKLEIH